MTDPDDVVLCGTCRRPLHEIASRALGLGPVCRRGLNDLAAHRPPAGQLALDIPLPDTDPKE